MMKFYQYYIGVEGAEMLVDYHQQGRITFAGKGYAPEYNNELSEELRKACYDTQKKGAAKSHYDYCYDDTEANYGLEGTGSTNTDYAWAVAMGTKFSTQYGFSVHVDKEGNEYPLIMIPEYDEAEVELQPMRSPGFRTLSWEIGNGRSYLGYTKDTLKLLEKEYYNYNFDEMLYTYAEVLNRYTPAEDDTDGQLPAEDEEGSADLSPDDLLNDAGGVYFEAVDETGAEEGNFEISDTAESDLLNEDDSIFVSVRRKSLYNMAELITRSPQ